ncbi:MAG: hypoxanthine phosphoribosyltransferase [Acholeplasmataceae bacterium]|nr:hypoxanthine phosphoribosyltransferase [Acholeplasmataceae bacterium]
MHKDIAEILVSELEIKEICESLGKEITNDYKDKNPILVGLLKGCIPFMSDLSKKIELKVDIAYMSVSSYHGGINSSGDVKIKMDLDIPIHDRHVLIIEDIVDTGNTIVTIVELLMHRGAKSVEIVTLLDKPEGRLKPYEPKYIGRTIPKAFVVGYGLDYDEYYRNLPYVGILDPKVYSKKESN